MVDPVTLTVLFMLALVVTTIGAIGWCCWRLVRLAVWMITWPIKQLLGPPRDAYHRGSRFAAIEMGRAGGLCENRACQGPLPTNARFCPRCGNRVASLAPVPPIGTRAVCRPA